MVRKVKDAKRKLDLGCGPTVAHDTNYDEVYGIDIINPNNFDHIKVVDLVVEPIPFPDDYFDLVVCTDFLEHIPKLVYVPTRRYSFIELMNEISRVLKTGGQFNATFPVYPNTQAFDDPTHVNQITFKTMMYFNVDSSFSTNVCKNYYGYTGSMRLLTFTHTMQEQVDVWFEKV